MIKKTLTVLLLMPFVLNAQVNTNTWGVEDTVLTITKTIDFGVVHDYLEIENLSGGPLDMRWVCHEPASWPVTWETDFTDPDSGYYDVQDLDSHDFVLPYPAGFSNKLIIGIDHQQIVHTDTLKFKVYPLAYPEDSLWLYYIIILNESGTGISKTVNGFQYLYSASESILSVQWDRVVDISVFELSGKLVHQEYAVSIINGHQIRLNELQTGVYLVNLISKSGEREHFKISVP